MMTDDERRAKNAARSKAWREKNPDYMKEYMKEYLADPEKKAKKLEQDRARYHADPAAADAKRREWREKNPEYTKEYNRQYNAAPERKARARDQKLRNKYGISAEDYDRLLAAQGGGCAICGTKVPGGRGKFFHVDHQHVDGWDTMTVERRREYIRGLLCNDHNVGLGHFQDSTDLLRKAADYLARHSTCSCGFDEALAAYRRGEETPGWDWMGDPGHSPGCPRI